MKKLRILFLMLLTVALTMTSCAGLNLGGNGNGNGGNEDQYTTVTIAEAKAACAAEGVSLSDFYVAAKVASVDNLNNGDLTLTDDTGSISVSGICQIVDGEEIGYIDMVKKPMEGNELLIKLKSAKKGIIMVSSEMPELLGVCDRILVMSGGRIAGELDAASATQEKIMELAARFA